MIYVFSFGAFNHLLYSEMMMCDIEMGNNILFRSVLSDKEAVVVDRLPGPSSAGTMEVFSSKGSHT